MFKQENLTIEEYKKGLSEIVFAYYTYYKAYHLLLSKNYDLTEYEVYKSAFNDNEFFKRKIQGIKKQLQIDFKLTYEMIFNDIQEYDFLEKSQLLEYEIEEIKTMAGCLCL